MGYHIILRASLRIRPEHIGFINSDYFYDDEIPAEGLRKPWCELLERWRRLRIGHYFYEFTLKEDNTFEFEIQKKPHRHSGNLEDDYKSFMANVLLPVASKILSCEIEHDDFGMGHTFYTEADVRDWVSMPVPDASFM